MQWIILAIIVGKIFGFLADLDRVNLFRDSPEYRSTFFTKKH